jgi:adenine deaminase
MGKICVPKNTRILDYWRKKIYVGNITSGNEILTTIRYNENQSSCDY